MTTDDKGKAFIWRFCEDDNFSERAANDVNEGYGEENKKVKEFVEYSAFEKAIEALRTIRGWREIDRDTLGERLTAIEEIVSKTFKSLGLDTGGEG